jgi:hypothetical protein
MPVYVTTTAADAVSGNLFRNVANWQVEAIGRGACIAHPHAYVPGRLLKQNAENCNGDSQ